MSSNRLEAFSDGVIAIIITIMVLELKLPRGDTWAALAPTLPIFLSYVLSFVYVGIYWNNHHHLLQIVDEVKGGMLWANLHFLFWLSLFPFATAWMGENHAAAAPSALYGAILLMAAVAWLILQRTIMVAQGAESLLREAVGSDWKGKLSPVLYVAGTAAAFASPALAQVIYAAVAMLWLVPDRRIEHVVASRGRAKD